MTADPGSGVRILAPGEISPYQLLPVILRGPIRFFFDAERRGSWVHVTVRAVAGDENRPALGRLVMTSGEWQEFAALLTFPAAPPEEQPR